MSRTVFASAVLSLFAGGAALFSYQAPPTPQAPPAGATPVQAAPQRRGPAGSSYPVFDEAAVERGHKQFVSSCGFCHGANAKGGESGPDLLRSVVVLHDENGNQIGPVVLNGRPDKGMPKFAFTPQQISDIATFLHDRVQSAALRGTYKILNIVTGNASQGQAYFNGAGGCSGCHSVTGDLAHIASKYDAVTIQQKFVMPRSGRGGFRRGPEAETTKPVMVTVATPDGQTYTGKLERIDDFFVALTDTNGEYRSFVRTGDNPKVTVQDPLKPHIDLLSKYTDADIHNLTAYLVTLK